MASEFFRRQHVEGAEREERMALENMRDCVSIKAQQEQSLDRFLSEQKG